MKIFRFAALSSFISRIGFGHILAVMRKQKYSLLVLVLQIAITFAVLSNGLFIMQQRLEHIQRPSGIDESNSFVLTSSGFSPDFNPQNSIQTDLAALRSLPNVINAVSTYNFPYSGASDWHELQRFAEKNQIQISAARFNLDEHGLEALGLTLLAGENFSATDVIWQDPNSNNLPSVVILSAPLAKQLFNSDDWQTLVGQTIYVHQNKPLIIKGIVEQLQAPWDPLGKVNHSIIYPIVVTHNSARYFIRTLAGQLTPSIEPIVDLLASSNQQRMIRKVQTIKAMKNTIYQADIAALGIILTVMSALSLTVCLGIGAAANLQLLKHYQSIAIVRAIGANKTDILLQRIVENGLQSSLGVGLGIVLALGLNVLLVNHYAMAKLPVNALLIGAALTYLLGLLGTVKSCLKALEISPALASQNKPG